jgi:hypothetical protein
MSWAARISAPSARAHAALPPVPGSPAASATNGHYFKTARHCVILTRRQSRSCRRSGHGGPAAGRGGPCPRLARPLLVVRRRAASRRKPHRRVLRPPRRGPSSCRPGLTRRTSRSPPGSRHSLAKTPCRCTSKKPGDSVASGPCPRGGRNLEDLVNGFGAWRTVFDQPRSDPLRVARRDPGTSVPSGPSSGPRQPGARESRRPSDSHLIPDRKGVAR